jgi:hypothetical protein
MFHEWVSQDREDGRARPPRLARMAGGPPGNPGRAGLRARLKIIQAGTEAGPTDILPGPDGYRCQDLRFRLLCFFFLTPDTCYLAPERSWLIARSSDHVSHYV